MEKVIFLLMCVVAATVAEPPVPQGQYGAPGRLGGQAGYPLGPSANVNGGFSGYGDNGPDGEPANYEFQYDVDAPEYNVKFGHQEARQRDVAQGRYYVLLPDGRTQKVEYIADQDGYRPTITYEDPQGGYGSGGYPSSGAGGYTNGQGGYRR